MSKGSQNVYVASSWRNEALHRGAVAALSSAGHDVYNFRNAAPFGWREIDESNDRSWLTDPRRFREGLKHPIAQRGFASDMDALRKCDACVLVLPCGRSAHLELGWATGMQKHSIVLLDDPMSEPELMYLMCDAICVDIDEVIAELERGVR